ncbi:uncharacterized protein BX664DRAFT_339536 [Halteromyces radiatus]|uniref:uncharacterized protein n=1 Tax=Halteromyces radiatus TaxID=101107 RepID=UPI0022202B40|nr:uncharacterized protein BX664DRAFT_339536 [Halteromyces radiatus]KAI8082975.1 hypothetical protein BX664DRAFT_339536 [Halteromyces radiatus]
MILLLLFINIILVAGQDYLTSLSTTTCTSSQFLNTMKQKYPEIASQLPPETTNLINTALDLPPNQREHAIAEYRATIEQQLKNDPQSAQASKGATDALKQVFEDIASTCHNN